MLLSNVACAWLWRAQKPEWVIATAQSATRQPYRPCSSVACTVSSTAVKNAGGIEPSSTSSANRTPLPGGAGSTRNPTVARNGFGSVSMISYAAPLPAGRSMQIVVVSRNVTSTPKSSASVAWMTSFWTSP